MLPEPPLLPQPNPFADPGNLGHNIFRRCTISDPSRITIYTRLQSDPIVSGWSQPNNVLAEWMLKGIQIAIEIDISIEEAMTCCREYHLPIEPFITYEESDIDWLLYCGLAREYKQSIINADTINLTFYRDGRLYSFKTKLQSTSFNTRHTSQFVTIPLTLIPN